MINFRTSDGQGLSNADLIKIIEAAKAAEISRDKKGSLEAFSSIWEDIETDPNFSKINSIPLRAELYRLAGYFLSFYGKVEGIKNCQSRAKRMITKAINLFQDLNLKEKADEAYIVLAVSYWNSGDSENCDDILRQIEEDYANSPFESPFLQAKLTRAIALWARERYTEAIEMIENLTDKMKFSTDKSLKLSFHNKAGSIYMMHGIYDKGINHFKKGIKYATELKNNFLLGSQYNNLAYLYRELAASDSQYFEDAFNNIQKALEIFEELDAPGLVAVGLETCAGIHLNAGDSQKALENIDRSIKMMRQGDDYAVLVEALIVRFEIYVKIKNYPAALHDFSEAVELSRLHIGDFKVELLNQKINDLIYFREKIPLTEEVNEFKKHWVKRALIKNDFHRENTAKMLGITRGGLYEILEVQFPELYEELNISKRNRNSTSKKQFLQLAVKTEEKPSLKIVNPTKKILGNAAILQMKTPFSKMIYSGKKEADSTKMKCFYIPKEAGSVFDDDDDSVVLCNTSPEFSTARSLTIIRHNKSKTLLLALAGINQIKKDIYILDIDTEDNLITENFKVMGEVVGFCSSAESVGEVIVFKTMSAFF